MVPLFLDEIGDISLDMQTKLLRVLQEMTFERVGSSDSVKVDVRLIAATHQNLEKLIDQGLFRQDLYYRLNVISLTVPPLRERREDIPELAAHFLRAFAGRTGKPVVQLDDDVLSILKQYSWPGNVRQMENVIERALVVAESQTVTLADLPDELADELDAEVHSWGPLKRKRTANWFRLASMENGPSKRPAQERERLIQGVVQQARGNKAEAARAMGLAHAAL